MPPAKRGAASVSSQILPTGRSGMQAQADPPDQSKTAGHPSSTNPADGVRSSASWSGDVLGIDVGGTLMKGIVGREVDILDASMRPPVLRRPTEVHRGVMTIVDNITALAETLIAEAASRDHTVGGLGLAVPGLVDESNGLAVAATNIGWRELPLESIVSQRLGLPVVLRHDVRSGALAELRCGAAQHYRNFVFLPIGTGIACAIVCDGRPHRGEHFRAGEIGHIRVSSGVEPCGCGRTGCLETVASAAAIARRYQRETGQADVAAEHVIAAAAGGDVVARRIWTDAMDSLAEAILASNTLLDIDHYIVGGGLLLAGDRLMSDLGVAMAHYPHEGQRPMVEPSVLGPDAGVIGAAIAAADGLRRGHQCTEE